MQTISWVTQCWLQHSSLSSSTRHTSNWVYKKPQKFLPKVQLIFYHPALVNLHLMWPLANWLIDGRRSVGFCLNFVGKETPYKSYWCWLMVHHPISNQSLWRTTQMSGCNIVANYGIADNHQQTYAFNCFQHISTFIFFLR